ncbi:MAG: AAA family ATPase, partial [Desulfobulbaceae bacterium]|nr:AAA family ATPase [Desulfobulbaceae bacterium]
MAKKKFSYICIGCGAEFSKWSGQCPSCKEWDCLEESDTEPSGVKCARFTGYSGVLSKVLTMADVKSEDAPRFSTGMSELDRVLGGGLVTGSVVLIGGDPGVGKSTCLLQVCCNLSHKLKVLYITGEESLQQIAMRARRLGLPDKKLKLLAETQIERICEIALAERPKVMVIDSIQTMQAAEVRSAPGGVSQVKESASQLTRFAKNTGT